MLALYQCYILEKTGRKLTYNELEEEDFDDRIGHGLFILPKIEEKDMKKIKKLRLKNSNWHLHILVITDIIYHKIIICARNYKKFIVL